MVKRATIFSLREGVDPDEAWKFWQEVHALNFKKMPGLRRYMINRAIKVLREGDVKFWGLVESWWDNEDAYEQARNSSIGAVVASDGFATRMADSFAAWVEDKEIVFSNVRDNVIKSVGLYSLPAGTDPDKFWKYHTEVHAADVKRVVGSGLKGYIINRVIRVAKGEPKYWGLIEMWWESEQARVETGKGLKALKTPEGKTLADDFETQVIGHATNWMEEAVILP